MVEEWSVKLEELNRKLIKQEKDNRTVVVELEGLKQLHD